MLGELSVVEQRYLAVREVVCPGDSATGMLGFRALMTRRSSCQEGIRRSSVARCWI